MGIMRTGKTGRQKGVTMLELAIAGLVMGLTLIVALRTFRVILKGVAVSQNQMRADNLLLSSLDDLKNAASKSAYDGTWASLTYTPLSLSYTTAAVMKINGRSYTLQINPEWVTMTANTIGLYTAASPAYSNMVRFWGTVTWTDYFGSKSISKTAYASYLRQ